LGLLEPAKWPIAANEITTNICSRMLAARSSSWTAKLWTRSVMRWQPLGLLLQGKCTTKGQSYKTFLRL
jgi:hypothetical protein